MNDKDQPEHIKYMIVKDRGVYYALRRGRFLWWRTWVKIWNSEMSYYLSPE